MSTTELTRGALAFVFAIGCTGLDPDAFGARAAPPNDPEQAGWSFDAGARSDAGGRGSTTSSGRAGASEASRPGGGGHGEAGAGSADEGGAAGAPDDGTAARGSGGAGGSSSGRAGVGGTRAGGAGGMRPSGGAGGAGGRAAAGAAGDGRGGAPASHALFFSEYVEGSSSYKALEIQAREASTLAGCRLVTYFNGSSSGTGLALDGALAKGSVTTLCSTALAALVGDPCARATNLTFNGDDAIALECEGATLDVVGTIGVDPGDAWSSKGGSTLNQTLRRHCDASEGDPDGSNAFDPASEWTALPLDTFEGLGVAECSEN